MSWHFIYVRNGTYQSILGQDCTSTVLCVQGKRFLPRSKAAVRRGKKRISSRLKTRATANFIYPSDDSTFIRVIIPCNSPVERLPVDPWHIKRIDFLQKKRWKSRITYWIERIVTGQYTESRNPCEKCHKMQFISLRKREVDTKMTFLRENVTVACNRFPGKMCRYILTMNTCSWQIRFQVFYRVHLV